MLRGLRNLKDKKLLCKKITYRRTEFDPSPRVILGIITSEDYDFIKFRTARKEYSVTKQFIISIEDTNEVFRVE
jgi:hypothetical protein